MTRPLDGARRVYVMLRDAGPKGVHSAEVRRAAFPGSGNPSERFREIADHLEVRKRRENHGRSPGVRAWLAEFAPPGTELVTPANGVEGDGVAAASEGRPTSGNVPAEDGPVFGTGLKNEASGHAYSSTRGGSAADLNVQAADEQVGVKEPTVVARIWDYTNRQKPVYRELPVSQLEAERRAA